MKIQLLVLIFLLGLGGFLPLQSVQAANQPEEVASYNLTVTLDPEAKKISGQETIVYRNRQAEAIPDLVFHLYLNAFRSEDTLFMQENGVLHRANRYDPNFPGWIEMNSVRLQDGTELQVELLEDGTLARAELPAPVQPGEEIQLEVTFDAQLPKVFARTGFAGDFFMVGQWFPKLGVWQNGEWNAHPFHGNSEFYADFGNYEVQIRRPTAYLTGGTGRLLDDRDNGDGTRTAHYRAEGVIDFAWTTSPHFQVETRQAGGIEIVYLVLPENAWSTTRVLDTGEAALKFFGEWFGPYPYPRLTIVDVPPDGAGAGGMEYPTLVTAGTSSLLGVDLGPLSRSMERSVELVTAHEIGHQWFQSMIATNEAEEPWLDEGFTDYATLRLVNQLYGETESAAAWGNWKLGYLDLRRSEYLFNPQVSMYGKAWDFDTLAYGIASYSKPALSLLTLERTLGEKRMLEVMQAYFNQYQYRHPTTEDFRKVATEVSGENLDWFFDGLVYGKGSLNYELVSVGENQFTAARQGELVIPTEIEVVFEDGQTLIENWDGQDPERTFTYPNRAKIERVQIDPQRKIVVDLRWLDNGLTRQTNWNAWAAVTSRMINRMQNWLLMWGGL